MQEESIYIYGVLDGQTNRSFTTQGIGEGKNQVFCLPYKDITIVASHTLFIEYDPTGDNILAHEKVVQEVLKEGFTIAPMRFCTILKNKEEISKLCHSCYLPFKKNILRIRGKNEYSVKVFLNVDKLVAEVDDDKELLNKSNEIATRLYETIKTLAVDHILEEQMTKEMILNATFLIRKERTKEFYEEINQFDQQFTDKLKIRISGPTAPYNFVDMPTKPR